MNKKLTYKILNIVVIFVMFSHITFIHNLVQNYVLCFGVDGHIQIENINDCEECTNINIADFSSGTENSVIQQSDCEDIPLNSNCFEESQFISKDSIVSINIIKSNVIIIPETREITYFRLINRPANNHILDNYTTVSLTI